MVGYGQIVCLPRGPRCDLCPVSQYCPSSELKKIIKKQKKVIKKTEETSTYLKKEVEEDGHGSLEW